jgi:hypothetical protein
MAEPKPLSLAAETVELANQRMFLRRVEIAQASLSKTPIQHGDGADDWVFQRNASSMLKFN